MTYSIGQRRRKWSKIWLVVLVVMLVGISSAVFVIRRTYYQNLRPVSASQRSILFTVPRGASVQEIGSKLQTDGLIRASWAFEWYVRNHNLRDQLQAGTYALRPNQTVEEIIIVLTHGKVATDLVTILPGQRLDQIRDALINNAGFSPEAVDAALNPKLYADSPALSDKPANANLEGYLYPESFQKTADTKPETIIRASLEQMHEQLTPSMRAALIKQGLTVHEAVILASIIEQEVSKNEDKPVVAQVFLTRLKRDMALQSDPTAVYGALKAGQTLTLVQSLGYDSPYNTYLHPGLPPGPISNVSVRSLQAVAEPAQTDYVYFVAGDDGTTYFSRTIEEHQALTKKHCTKCGQ